MSHCRHHSQDRYRSAFYLMHAWASLLLGPLAYGILGVGGCLFYIYLFLIEGFTVLCWFIPNINKNQPWIYSCPLPHEHPSQLPAHSTLLGCYWALVWAPRATANPHWLSILHMVVWICMLTLFIHPTLYFLPGSHAHKSVLSVCVAIHFS